jgi:ferredoxin/flavodoxin---NADP+ reductase
MAQELNATVTFMAEVSHGLFVMRVKPDFPVPAFKSGQYAVLGLFPDAPRAQGSLPETIPSPSDKMIRRAYSIASGNVDRGELEFLIALVPDGALTPRLYALKPGAPLFVGPKIVGMFTLDDVPSENDLLFVATGTGLAPYMSMLRSNFCFGCRHRTSVIHGARNSWSLGYRPDLEALEKAELNFSYLPVVSRPENETLPWQGATGRVTSPFDDGSIETLLGRPFNTEKLSVFLCGNPAMVIDLIERLTAMGFMEHSRKVPGNLFVEKYW